MAITQFTPNANFGGDLGKALGTGLGGVLEGLSERHVKKIKGQKLEKAGIPKEILELDPTAQAAYVKGLGKVQQEARTNQELDNIRMGNFGQQSDSQQQPGMQQAQEAETQAEQIEAPRRKSREFRLSEENENYERALNDPRYSGQAKAKIQERIQQNEDHIQKIREYRDKTYGKELGEMREEYLSARDWKDNSDRLKELEAEGLPSNKLEAFLKGANIDIAALRQGSGEEYNKIIASQIKNAKNFFGGRISNFELESFMNTLPTLMNSPEGRKRVLAQIDRLNNLKIAAYKTASDIRKENKGITPDDLWDQVDERLEKKRDAISKQFKADLKRPVPESENRFGIGASYAAGKAAPILGAAGLGAGIGSIVPGIGTGLGAGIGGIGAAAAPYLSQILRRFGNQ